MFDLNQCVAAETGFECKGFLGESCCDAVSADRSSDARAASLPAGLPLGGGGGATCRHASDATGVMLECLNH